MGAGIAASPHFPWADARAREGQAFHPWRIGIQPKPCGSDRFPLGSPRRDIAARSGPQFGCSSKHCCSASVPRSPLEYRYSADSCRARIGISLLRRSPFRSAIARRLRRCRTCFGKWGRLGLAPSPHASSWVRPSNASVTIILADVRRICGGLGLRLSFVSESPFPTADDLYDSLVRVAPSGI